MKPIIQIGFDEGEADFSVSAKIQNLNKKQMDELRAMTMVAVGIAENMWRDAKFKENPANKVVDRKGWTP